MGLLLESSTFSILYSQPIHIRARGKDQGQGERYKELWGNNKSSKKLTAKPRPKGFTNF